MTNRCVFKICEQPMLLRRLRFTNVSQIAGTEPSASCTVRAFPRATASIRPSRRYQSAQEVADELERFALAHPIEARPITNGIGRDHHLQHEVVGIMLVTIAFGLLLDRFLFGLVELRLRRKWGLAKAQLKFL